MEPEPSAPSPPPSPREALRFWSWLGWVSFGGPAGQIALMHRELVERRRWVDETSFLRGLAFCNFLPGPEAQQLATWLGWRLHGWKGGVAAGALFVLPAVGILLALSWLSCAHGREPAIAAGFWGLNAAVIALVASALVRIGRKALASAGLAALALAAFAALRVLALPFPAIVFGAALLGVLGARFLPAHFAAADGHAAAASAASAAPAAGGAAEREQEGGGRGAWKRALRIGACCLALWWAPVLAAGLVFGFDSELVALGSFFSRAALVTFGGAYAVLPYVAEHAVERAHWLDSAQMLNGLGLAETTPGPLIMVVQHVGFCAGWNHPGALDARAAAVLGALMATWVTFLPCFLWILVCAPFVERWSRQPAIGAALRAISAAVVGVILDLALTLGARVLVPAGELDLAACALALVALALLARTRVGTVWIVLGAAALGLVRLSLRG